MNGLAAYTRIIAAGATSNIAARGRFVALRAATAEVKVTVRQNQVEESDGEAYSMLMVAKERWFLSDEFDSVEVANESGGSITVTVLIGHGSFEFSPV